MSSLFHNLGPSIFEWLPWSAPSSGDELWDLFEKLREDRGFIIYAIRADPGCVNPQPVLEQSDEASFNRSEVLGTIGYLEVDPQHRSLEVGAVLFGPALRRSAAATEAHYLVLRNVCEPGPADSPAYRRIAWKCDSSNTASRRAAERIGYVCEGTFRNHMISNGRSRDSDWLSIIEDEWPTIKKALEGWLDPSNFDENGKQIIALDEIRASYQSSEDK